MRAERRARFAYVPRHFEFHFMFWPLLSSRTLFLTTSQAHMRRAALSRSRRLSDRWRVGARLHFHSHQYQATALGEGAWAPESNSPSGKLSSVESWRAGIVIVLRWDFCVVFFLGATSVFRLLIYACGFRSRNRAVRSALSGIINWLMNSNYVNWLMKCNVSSAELVAQLRRLKRSSSVLSSSEKACLYSGRKHLILLWGSLQNILS